MKRRHLRAGDRIDDDEIVIVRGGELDPIVLRADALRYHSVYGTYGISVFALRGITVDELAQQPPLVRFPTLTLVAAGVLRSAGLRLEPTGRNPQHFTVGFGSLDDSIEILASCEQRLWRNPYHEE